MKKAFGVDFGTTNTSIVQYDLDNGLTQITSKPNQPYPSVVCYQGNEILVGHDAKKSINEMAGNPGRTIIKSIKTKLGKNEDIFIMGEPKKIYDVAAEIISYIIKENEMEGQIKEAVLTIPVGFDGEQRRDLRKTAEKSGISVNAFIHEPFAAVIGWLKKDAKNKEINGYILVFDWGGGTLDITVTKKEGIEIFEYGTAEMSGIAGDKFDELLKNYCIDKVLRQSENPIIFEKAMKEPSNRDLINYYIELCKIDLSAHEESKLNFTLRSDGNNLFDFKLTVKRKEFEDLIAEYIERAIEKIKNALQQANIDETQIEKILLVGGTSLIPILIKRISDEFVGYKIVSLQDANELIAEGAAIAAYFGVKPVFSKKIMMELSDGTYYIFYEKGQEIRTSVEQKVNVCCVDFRNSAHIVIAEGNNNVSADREIGFIELERGENLKMNNISNNDQIEVLVSTNEDYILNVKAKSVFSGNEVTEKIHIIGMGVNINELS